MKKKGFTLIELLAVIVILAIIALIATPIVMNTIENAKKGAAERSAENYMDAVETEVAKQRIDGVVLEGEYTIQSDGSLCKGSNVTNCERPIKIDMSGNKPSSGTIKIANGLVTTNSTMTFADNYTVSYDSEKNSYVAEKANPEDENKSVVVYRWSAEEVNIGAELSSFTYVENLSDLSKDYYLKHVLDKDNKVVESWVCVKDGVVEKACVRGGSADYYGDNSKILNSLQDKDVECYLSGYAISCNVGPVMLYVDSTGYVDAHAANEGCAVPVFADGGSYCAS